MRLFRFVCFTLGLAIFCQAAAAQALPASPNSLDDLGLDLTHYDSRTGSPYIPLDSWIYPAVIRLQGLGYADSAFLGLRPWTRLSLANILAESAHRLGEHPQDEEAWSIFLALAREIKPDLQTSLDTTARTQVDNVYVRLLGIAGPPLRDSFHAGQTIANDYGRPYAEGFNEVAGGSFHTQSGRFVLYLQGEQVHAPGWAGYSIPVSQTLSAIDGVPYGANQATIPQDPVPAANDFRLRQAYMSVLFVGNEFSFGKSDEWMGVATGGGMAWSNNAEDMCAFRIDRIEPFRIPGLSLITGPFRYDFLVATLKGHTYPNAPWVHGEKISFKPTQNLEMGFERTVIWGGAGHVPITIHTFLKSFFSVQNVSFEEKESRNDPGARFGAFDFSYRLPFLRKWVTVYADSEAHDDVNPISAPRRAAYRPGIYFSHFPSLFPNAAKLDLRVEAASTDPPNSSSVNGQFMYWEYVQRQGYTNKGQIFGDWIGREGKGGQAWLTYHLSGNEWVQVAYRNAKVAKDFVPGGTTQNLISVQVVKRLTKDVELNAWLQGEKWKAPLLQSGGQTDFATAAGIVWYPKKNVPAP